MNLARKMFRFNLSLLLLLFTLFPLQAFAQAEQKPVIEYVALGDSLAHGYLNENYSNEGEEFILGKGYPVFIAEGIEERLGYEVNLTNGGFSGFQTADVLKQLHDNDDNIRDDIERADFVTLGIGANDLLGLLLQLDIDDIDITNPEDLAKLEGIFAQVPERINSVGTNISEIITEIQKSNSDAQIYVMGYYNAFSFLDEQFQQFLIPFMHNLNSKIQEVVVDNGAVYVPTFEAFVGKYENYFPEPDIHPNEAGYQVLAEQFLEKVVPYVEVLLDTIKPEITLHGDNPMKLNVGDEYVEPGATAIDNVDGDLTDSIEISGDVDPSKAGTYTVTYTVSDTAGNIAELTRTINIIESKEPVQPKEPSKPSPSDPKEPPADPRKPVDQPKDQHQLKNGDNTPSSLDKKGTTQLPSTATTHPLTMLIGSLLALTGGSIILIRRKVLSE